MHTVIPIPAFNDNYIWCIAHDTSKECIIIDPGNSKPVIDTITRAKLNPIAILLTHHHLDHTGGVADLQQHYTLKTFGPKSAHIPMVTHIVDENQPFQPGANWPLFQVINTPGHTLDHVCYYSQPWLFCGDTLFSGGCGRVFEGSYQQMLESLNKLATLPPETLIYCAHEYTLKNLEFARSLEPNNNVLLKKIIATKKLRDQQQTTLPSLLSDELAINPFLRSSDHNFQQTISKYAGKTMTDPVTVFEYTRQLKDRF